MPDAGLLAALQTLVPAGAGVGWADPALTHPLMPTEQVPGAVPARLREFAAGRAAARMALSRLGIPAQPIPKGDDRAPIWPAGVVGSITHTRAQCLAVVMRTDHCRGIGIDLEDESPLDPDLWPTILRPEERVAMTGLEAKRVFCAKEAAYKAQYSVSRTLYGFHAMRVQMGEAEFSAAFCQPVPPFALGDRVAGRIRHVGGHILALALL